MTSVFSFIRKSLYPTPLMNHKTIVYEGITPEQFLSEVTASPLRKEGVFGIEQFIDNGCTEESVFTPHIYKLDYPKINRDLAHFLNESAEPSIYELKLKHAFCFPLDTNCSINLLESLKTFHLDGLFTQTLFSQRSDSWKDSAIAQYEDFLEGNDYPSTNHIIRSIQTNVLHMLNRIGNKEIQRNRIDDIEKKILSPGYRFEMRFIVFNSKDKRSFEDEIKACLETIVYYNELELFEVKFKRDFLPFILERKFQPSLKWQIISEKELWCTVLEEDLTSIMKQVNITLPQVKAGQPIISQSRSKVIVEGGYFPKAIQILPFKEKESPKVNHGIVSKINQALIRVKAVKSPLEVSEIFQGASLLKLQMKMPEDVNYSTIKRKFVDVQAAMGNETITLEIGDKPDTFNLFIPLDQREVIYFRNVLEVEEFQDFRRKHPLPFIIGESANGGYLFSCLADLRHLLVAGATGSGKSVFINLMILSFLLCIPPKQICLYLVDPKTVELSQFKGFPQVKEIITDMSQARQLLSSLCMEMESRYDRFSKAGCRNIGDYNEIMDEKMPFIVCIIDEFADLIMTNGEVEEYIARLGAKARGAGIHLVIATQRPSVDIITGVIKANFPSRLSFSVASQVDSRTILDKGGAEKLLGRGDGLAKLETSLKTFERFQSPVLTLDIKEEKRIFQQLKALFEDIDIQNEILPEEEKPIEKLKRIIAATNETQITKLQKNMGIRTESVIELIKELVDEGWLKKKGRSYEIIASEEELQKWRNQEGTVI